jgi:hypothetical protein
LNSIISNVKNHNHHLTSPWLPSKRTINPFDKHLPSFNKRESRNQTLEKRESIKPYIEKRQESLQKQRNHKSTDASIEAIYSLESRSGSFMNSCFHNLIESRKRQLMFVKDNPEIQALRRDWSQESLQGYLPPQCPW